MLDEFPPSYRFSHGSQRREVVVHAIFFPVSASPCSVAAAEAELVSSKTHQPIDIEYVPWRGRAEGDLCALERVISIVLNSAERRIHPIEDTL